MTDVAVNLDAVNLHIGMITTRCSGDAATGTTLKAAWLGLQGRSLRQNCTLTAHSQYGRLRDVRPGLISRI